MSKRKTQAEFENEIELLVGDEYKVLEKYTNAITKIEILHNKCGRTFDMKPNKFLSGRRCPHCYRDSIIINKDNFVDKISEKHGDEYLLLDDYVDIDTPLRFKHNIDGCEKIFKKTPYHFYNKNSPCGCDLLKENKTRAKKEYEEKLFKLTGDEYKLVGDYQNANSTVTLLHNKYNCNKIFTVNARDFYRRGQRCPHCFSKFSNGEERILNFLHTTSINYLSQYGFKNLYSKQPLRFDFAIFDKTDTLLFLIEYDGEQHFKPVDFAGKGKEWAKRSLNNIKARDQIKNNYCKDNAIKLLRIPYWEFENIENILIHYLIEPIEDFKGSFLCN